MSDFSLEPTGVTPPPPPSERVSTWRAAAIVLAVLCLGLGFWLFRATDGFGSTDEGSPEAMVSMACSIMDDINPALGSETEEYEPDQGAFGRDIDRLGAATALSRLAAREDSTYREFRDVVSLQPRQMSGSNETDLASLIEDSQAYCADR